MGYQMDVGSLLLSAETQAARVEGILLADPALAGLWRMETSLLEAAASVGLEGERISTQGMVLRLTSGTAMDEDARAVEMALKLLTVIRRPGDPFGAPVAALRRIEDGSYGYCEETGEPISLKRLDARPIATLSIEAQERHERRERVYRDD